MSEKPKCPRCGKPVTALLELTCPSMLCPLPLPTRKSVALTQNKENQNV